MSVGQILSDPTLRLMHSNAQTAYLSGNADPFEALEYLREGARQGKRLDVADLDGPYDLEVAKYHLEQFDFIGIVEELEEFLPGFCSAMGYHPMTFFRHDNHAPDGASDFTGLSEDEVQMLQDCNDLDLQLYQWAVELVQGRRKDSAVSGLGLHAAITHLCDAGIYEVQNGSFEIDLGGPIPGSGWYEPDAEPAIRWTGPHKEFSLELPLQADGRYRGLMKFHSRRPFTAENFTVTANGVPLEVEVAVEGNIYSVAFEITPFHVEDYAGVCQLIFDVGAVFSPASEGGSDRRKLGVAVMSLRFERLD
jgi:hypothetical protein